jgi:hypothetical protein
MVCVHAAFVIYFSIVFVHTRSRFSRRSRPVARDFAPDYRSLSHSPPLFFPVLAERAFYYTPDRKAALTQRRTKLCACEGGVA